MIYQSLLSRLRSQHEAIPEILSGVTDEKIYARPADGKWSIFENLVHLAKYQPIFIERMTTILQNDNPAFDSYSSDNDPEFLEWLSWPLDTVLEQMEEDRMHLFGLISNLNAEELARKGVHAKYGSLNIIQWTEFCMLHEAHHLLTMFKLANGIAA